VRVKGFTSEDVVKLSVATLSVAKLSVAKLSEVNNKKTSRNRKVESKGHAVIERGKINLKLVTLMMTKPMEMQITYSAENSCSHNQLGDKWAHCWVNRDSFVSSMYSKNL
jgi:hypothetical protein